MDPLVTNGVAVAGGALSTFALKVPEFLREIYGDLAKPAVKEVGEAIGGVLGLGNTILFPIHLINGRAKIALQSNFERYRKKIDKILPEDLIEPVAEIAVPLLECLSYVTNEHLSDMYCELLAKSSSRRECQAVHPGLVEMIRRLSPDEANFFHKVYELKGMRQGLGFPLLQVRVRIGEKSFRSLDEVLCIPQELDGIPRSFYEDTSNMLIENMVVAGLFKRKQDRCPSYINPSKSQIQTQIARKHENTLAEGEIIQFKWEAFEMTALGEAFAKAALPFRSKG